MVVSMKEKLICKTNLMEKEDSFTQMEMYTLVIFQMGKSMVRVNTLSGMEIFILVDLQRVNRKLVQFIANKQANILKLELVLRNLIRENIILKSYNRKKLNDLFIKMIISRLNNFKALV